MKTGIALSGGGVRATVFHLGVLARLAETELWTSLEHISTVSGGSLCVALIFEKAGKQWPTADAYLNQCLPEIFRVLTSYDLEKAYLCRAWLHALEGRAHVVAKLIEKNWGVTSCISEIPEANPRWSINATCYETGKNWRFHKKRMGDYIANYVVNPKFPLSDAVAASAAVPGLIGPLRIKTGRFAWKKYSGWDESSAPDTETPPITKSLTIWDGGVYDNLGAETIYKSGKGLRDDLDFALICDASKPLGILRRQWIRNIALPRKLTRLVDIPMDQVRGLRARELFSFFKKNSNGGYLRMGESVPRICKNLQTEVPTAKYLSQAEVDAASGFDTTLRKLSPKEFQIIFRHGYEVSSAVLYGIKQSAFVEYDQKKFTWIRQ
jgi:NTE family protein